MTTTGIRAVNIKKRRNINIELKKRIILGMRMPFLPRKLKKKQLTTEAVRFVDVITCFKLKILLLAGLLHYSLLAIAFTAIVVRDDCCNKLFFNIHLQFIV